MKLDLILSQRPELRLQLSPQLIQRIEILQLGAADLRDLIENELLTNEVLDAKYPPNGAVSKQPAEEQREEAAAQNGPVDSEPRAELDQWMDYAPRRRRGGDDVDPKQEALSNTPSRPQTLAEHLEAQLALETVTPKVRELVLYLVHNLDHNGWLKDSLDELMIPVGLEPGDEEAIEALRILQSLDPPGVGARTPKECLLLQLSPGHPRYGQLHKLISHSLEDLARNRLPKVARDLGESVDTVKDLASILRHDFDPFPGRSFVHEAPRRVKPDVVVEKIEDQYEIRLEDDYLPRLSVDSRRVRAMRSKDMGTDLRKQLRRDVESARWLIESIEQRKRTLERVAREIVTRQEEFLENGVNHLKPLKMQEVADELGIHVSTVSRALKGKYIQTPQGIHEMKYFFTGASRGTDGVVESRAGVKERVREIIDREDRHNPMSDEEIVEKLKAMGLDIARRTVTKYRKSMGIPSSRQRREY